ncbi:ScbA/BarX family gamma-butyrolactone biosynthesis protein [Streptomyces sp. HNM0663]|uniref:ScbA/BarX family gamma-butyrolactone biosynthesis protein n=1 Tax=Streptomyces chengmaiensis TaxID=3040919 RepID=A0ABT6HGH2_9ACTN|nr:ScbA/BarX family gamma-butyrolactone biosynthesis protein [Streptomyces chengmaiensis]MDH2387385.1 ScbA/BarX family gamma-butyrolactone biosynthesis protein [Streptomyces chengmaiensis]
MYQCRLRREDPEHRVRADPELDFQRTVARRLVHRAAVAEVFVTDAMVLGENHFLVGGQWPRDHALYHPDAQRRSDPLLFAETIRQALVYLAHWHYEVPLGHRFVGYDMDFKITDPDALCVGGRPIPVELEARWQWTDRRPPRRYGARLEVALSVGGRRCGRGSLRVVALDERSYRIVRGRSGRAESLSVAAEESYRRVEPGLVGRLRDRDSVLVRGSSAAEWLLRPNPDHAILFDHPTDHLPLMVLLEGFRQLGHLMTHSATPRGDGPALTLVSAAVDCLAFAELDVPTRLVVREKATADDPAAVAARAEHRLHIDALQGDTLVASCASVWAPVRLVTTADQPVGLPVPCA